MRRNLPAVCHPELNAALDAARVTCADVDAYWVKERSERSDRLGSSLLGQVGQAPLACDPLAGFEARAKPDDESEIWETCEGQAFRRAVALVHAFADFGPSVPLPVEPLPSDTLIDPVRLRVSRVRDTVRAQASLISQRLAGDTRRWRLAFVTLTYRDPDEWRPYQVTRCVDAMKKWAKRRGFGLSYVWVAELGEKTGRLHYHVCVWLPRGLTMPKPDKQGWWPWGHTRIEWARNQAAAAAYLGKYMTKGGGSCEASFPPGCRIHGCGGLTVPERLRMAWGRCPSYVREHWPDWRDEPRRAPGGGWLSRVTGELIEAAFVWVGVTVNGLSVIRPRRPDRVVLTSCAVIPEGLL